jgi:NADPH:quinone reductase-like Zn-dependent oxidoreductase
VSLRAAGIETYGAEVRLLELPEPPPPGDGEVLIEVEAAGVANWDDFVRTGGWDVGRTPPLALGVEAAGGVIGVGPGVQWPATGAAVMTHPLPLPYQGCWADRLVAPADLVAEKPDAASWAEAGAFPVPALTAAQVVAKVLNVQAGETLLVNGGGGLTGGFMVELAAYRGATVIATASPRSAERATALGADIVLDYHDPEWTRRAIDAGIIRHPGGRQRRARRRGGRIARARGWRPSGHHHRCATPEGAGHQHHRCLRPSRRRRAAAARYETRGGQASRGHPCLVFARAGR